MFLAEYFLLSNRSTFDIKVSQAILFFFAFRLVLMLFFLKMLPHFGSLYLRMHRECAFF
nr:MAG TPA: hypothetical protein [Caudoviricetes sp.]